MRRLALTWDQVQRYSPPPNPAKSTDARYRKYAAEHGDESCELDALEPTVLGTLTKRDASPLTADEHRELIQTYVDRARSVQSIAE